MVPAAHDHPADSARAPSPLSQRVRALRLPSQQATGSWRVGWIAWLLCLAFAASTAVLGFLLAMRQPDKAASGSGTADPAPGSSPAPAGTESLPAGEIALHVRGYVIPSHQNPRQPSPGHGQD